MTRLATRLAERIARTGPMTVADFMTECLLHPTDGYYATRDPLGRAGDFITAPEISQMFGELIGLWLAQVWMDQGRPAPMILCELGPGRGTLMVDLLRATAGVAGFHDALELHLVEASPVLRAAQTSALQGWTCTFHDGLDTVPDKPFLCVANEFFDALPIRQFQRGAADGWHERVLGAKDEHLLWGLAPPAPVQALEPRLAVIAEGQMVETCAPAEAFAQNIGARVAEFGGAALIIDYGGWESIGDTFQAVQDHAFVDPLDAPGQSDLTAHVAFAPITRAAAPAVASGLTQQGVFLERLGITQRAQALADGLSGPALESHVAAHRRLTHPAEMGHLFKVLALTPPGAAPPPALD